MKLPYCEDILNDYCKDPLRRANFLRYYPRRIACPLDYFDPKYYSIMVCTYHEMPPDLMPKEELVVACNLQRAGMPTYFLDGDFMQAVAQTEIEDKVPIQDLKLPLDDMILCLPYSVSKAMFGWAIPYVCYTLADATSEGETVMRHKSCFVMHMCLLPDDGKPFGYHIKMPVRERPIRLQEYPFINYIPIAEKYIEHVNSTPTVDKPYLLPEHDSTTCKLPTPEDDKALPVMVFHLLYKLLHVLETTS